MKSFRIALFALLFASCLHGAICARADNWNQPAGPNGDWSARGKNPPLRWSVSANENILWRTKLPEAGQSGIAVWGDRLFLTSMKPLPDANAPKQGHDVVGYCLNSKTGAILWTVDLPGTEDVDYAYGFSDSTSPSPVTDGKHVWFFNSSGSVGCWDYRGKQVWMRRWKPTSDRPFNKQFEPILFEDVLITMEPREPGDPLREKDAWNYLKGLDKRTGKVLWISEDSLTHYNTPMFGRTAEGAPAILQGRGGYHDVPETPIGLTLTSLAEGQEGRSMWRYLGEGKALYTMRWDKKYAYWLPQDSPIHQVVDIQTGKLLKTQSLVDKADYRRYDAKTGGYVLESAINLAKRTPAFRVFPGWFTNIVVGDFHYFLCFTDPAQHLGPPYCVGRVNIKTDKVEYLELPVQVYREAGKAERFVWNEPQPSSTVNSRGIDVAGDPRSRRDGWFWCFLGNPVVVNDKIFFTTMLGVTYVIDGKAKTLDERALLAVNDLGAPGQTWSLNSISYANGRLYHRSMKEVVCIGAR